MPILRGKLTHDRASEINKSVVYKFLSHHYILKRSIVFIVDTDYSSDTYKQIAGRYVMSFFGSMQPTDCFGYIRLGYKSDDDEILLEPKMRNTKVKTLFLKSMKDKESEIRFGNQNIKRKYMLQEALKKALDWQMT